MQKSDHLTLFPSVYLFEVWLVLDFQCKSSANPVQILLIVPFSYIYSVPHDEGAEECESTGKP